MAYLDNTGLNYFWGKIKSALSSKQNKITASGMLKGDSTGGITAAEAGTDYAAPSLGLTGAAVGQAAVVMSVDADGKPTAWKPANFGNADVFIIDCTADETDNESSPITLTPSKTYDEVRNAILEQKQCYAQYDGIYYPLAEIFINAAESNNITTIDANAFAYSMCENVIIPETVTLIGDTAFSSANIGTMILPGSVTRISSFAFQGVRGVNGVAPVIKLNEGLAAIGQSAFNSASIAGEIEIPSTVTEIGEYCFAYTGITTVICKPTTPPALGTGAFSSDTAGFTIKVPAASVAAYKAADGWKDYANYIVAM